MKVVDRLGTYAGGKFVQNLAQKLESAVGSQGPSGPLGASPRVGTLETWPSHDRQMRGEQIEEISFLPDQRVGREEVEVEAGALDGQDGREGLPEH